MITFLTKFMKLVTPKFSKIFLKFDFFLTTIRVFLKSVIFEIRKN